MSEQLLDVLKAQRRRRRTGFWLGFFVILLFGGLWAQLSKDPNGPNFVDDFGDDFGEVVVDREAPAILDQPTTTEALPVDDQTDEPTTTEPSVTTTSPTTTSPTTTAPTTEPPTTEAP